MRGILPILITISLLAFNFVQATAIKVSPPEIKIETLQGILTKKEIMVENPANNVALYEVYVDNFSDWIKFKPESFTLESGKKQKVTLEIKNEENGIFSTMISVVAEPLSQQKFKVGPGVKIPLEIKISSRGDKGVFLATIFQNLTDFFQENNLIYIFGIILIILILAGIHRERKKREKKKKLLNKDYYQPSSFDKSSNIDKNIK
ncbi:MAG: hypothetical protein QME61_03235 [Patescibacteria group bacterium]|nr:hypothetical protein [Patescibacteria group bacterium]